MSPSLKKKTSCVLFVICAILSSGLYAASVRSLGPFGASFTCIEISKSNPNIALVGTQYGGVYKSTDSGDSWDYLGFKGDTTITSIATDAIDSNIIYFTWSKKTGIWTTTGLTRTKDGGKTWENMNKSSELVVTSKSLPNRVFVGNGSTLFISKNAGNNFIKIHKQFYNHISAIEADPIDTSIIYLGNEYAIYKSTDSGINWVEFKHLDYYYNGNPAAARVSAIAVSELDNDILIVATEYFDLLISQDGGQSWQSKKTGDHIYDVFCDNENIIYTASSDGCFKSTDLGVNFSMIKDGNFISAKMGDSKIYLIEDEVGGISISNDEGLTWESSSYGISNIQVYAITMVNDELFAVIDKGSEENLIKYADRDWITIKDQYVGKLLKYNGDNSSLCMAYSASRISVSNYPFDTWISRYATSGIATDLAVCGDNLYITSRFYGEEDYGGIYRSADNGESWSSSSQGLPIMTRYIYDGFGGGHYQTPVTMMCICIDPAENNILYACSDSEIYKSMDYGGNWDKIATIDSINITDIAVDPTQNSIIYFITGSAFYKSIDCGLTFEKISIGQDEVYCMYYDVYSNAIYLGVNNGLVRSYDKGLTWENIGTGLDQVKITSIARYPQRIQELIYIGTDKSGIYEIDLSDNSNYEPTSDLLYPNYPNPFNPTTTIYYEIREASNAKLDIYNISGQLIETLADKYHLAGAYNVKWNASKYSSGIYIYCLEYGDKRFSRKMLLIK